MFGYPINPWLRGDYDPVVVANALMAAGMLIACNGLNGIYYQIDLNDRFLLY